MRCENESVTRQPDINKNKNTTNNDDRHDNNDKT